MENIKNIIELTPEDIKLIGESNLPDIRNYSSPTEMIGEKVIALFWNGKMDGYSFEVIELDEGIGNYDDNYVYNLEFAYLVISKEIFINTKYKGLRDYQKKLHDFQNAYNQLVGAFDDMENFEKDLVNENSKDYPFIQSLEDLKINDWVKSLSQLHRTLDK